MCFIVLLYVEESVRVLVQYEPQAAGDMTPEWCFVKENEIASFTVVLNGFEELKAQVSGPV